MHRIKEFVKYYTLIGSRCSVNLGSVASDSMLTHLSDLI